MMMWPFTRRSARAPKHLQRATPRRAGTPEIELLEDRRLLASSLLQGYAFVDANNNNRFDAGDMPKQGATIKLLDSTGNPVLDSMGHAITATTNADGYYRFDNVAPGTYQLVELPPSIYTTKGVQIQNLFDPAMPINGGTAIQVTVKDPTSLTDVTVNRQQPGGPPGAIAQYTLAGGPFNGITGPGGSPGSDMVHQYQINLTGSSVLPAAQGVNFYSFCVDLLHANPAVYKVSPSLTPAAPGLATNIGQIGYLYNHFGTGLLSPTNGAGLQLAIWELEYDVSPNLSAGNFVVTPPGSGSPTDAGAYAAAQNYLSLSTGKDERTFFLNVNAAADVVPNYTNRQGMIASEFFSFANVQATSDLKIQKTDNVGGVFSTATNNTTGGTIVAGQDNAVVYTIVVTNKGPGTATNQTVTDNTLTSISTSDSWMAVASPGSSVTTPSGTGNISDTVTLLPGGTVTFTVTATIHPAMTATSVVNTASVTLPTGDTTPADNTSTDTITVTIAGSGNGPQLHVTKTADQATINTGDTAGFTITVSNTGQTAATGVTLNDSLPSGLGHDINWMIDTAHSSLNAFTITGAFGMQVLHLFGQPITLNAGTTLTVHITGVTSANDANPCTFMGTLCNTVTVSATNATTQQASANITVLAPDVDVTKTADKATITAGDTAGFTVTIFNEGKGLAHGVTLSDPLPGGLGNDINWMIDTHTGNPGAFIISGAVGHQTLSLNPSNIDLAAGASLTVHITGVTSAADVGATGPVTPTPPLSGPLPGTVLNADGSVASNHGTQNVTPESQSRPEFTVTDVSFRVQTGYVVLLDSSMDPNIPEAGPPGGVAGVTSSIERNRPQDWSDVAQFVMVTDCTGTHGRIYWVSDPEGANKADIGTALDTFAANQGMKNPGLKAPGPNDPIVFLLEREAGNSGDTGAGESNPANKYKANNVIYNFHSDPPGKVNMPRMATLQNTATVNATNEAASEQNDHATATITIVSNQQGKSNKSGHKSNKTGQVKSDKSGQQGKSNNGMKSGKSNNGMKSGKCDNGMKSGKSNNGMKSGKCDNGMKSGQQGKSNNGMKSGKCDNGMKSGKSNNGMKSGKCDNGMKSGQQGKSNNGMKSGKCDNNGMKSNNQGKSNNGMKSANQGKSNNGMKSGKCDNNGMKSSNQGKSNKGTQGGSCDKGSQGGNQGKSNKGSQGGSSQTPCKVK